MRFAFDSNYSQSEAPIKGNKCFFNCQCICCRQGCCVVVVKCCCCYSLNCCNSLGSRKSFPQPAVMRKKVSDTEVLSVSKLVAVILVLARWVTALATLLTSCILLDIFSLPGQSGVADRSQASSRTVHVSVPTTPNGTPSSTSEAKLKLFYGYTSYDINNDQQVKSNNLCRVLCRSRNRKRQRRRRRRRRHRRRRHIYTKHHQMQRKQQKYLRTDHLMQSNVSNFEQRLNFNDGKCHSLETNYGTNYDLVHRGKPFGQSERSFLMSPLREIEAPWPSSQGSVRNCSKIKRNRANLIWLLIGLVWFEVKLINCNGISSSNYYASNLETHKGCTLCHDSGKPNIYTDKGTQYRQYRILEFSVQNRRVPTQKLSIRSAQIHIRIDKPHSFWIERAKSLPEEQWLNTKKKWGAKKPHHRIKIWVFQLSTSINITEMGIEKAIIFRASFDVDTKNLGWQKFDLTDTIRDWYSHTSHEKLRLLIDCTGCAGRYSLHLFQTSKLRGNSSDYLSTNPNRPFLVLHTESSRTRRVRRRAIDCGGALNGQCCKESFYVSFKALGWDDWIIAPRGYFANYCRGDCTGSFRTPDTFQTFHAHFIEEYRKMGLLNGMRPCCAPIKFSSMSLIYYGDDGIIKRDLPKMVVDECGCP
ncbi:inhibin beta chain isoform X4 [Drosophila santomea]|uniref:inhibin beta chain isoform X4 n=1 Tax=Drosophila santomea TaxID=129105 RepID=UPI001952E4E4|nr:inhibin beta chain isoform X4 [Drosophila santomea]